MVIFSLKSKRLRRPNVRLWEIGDLSAAFACGSSHRTGASLGQQKWKRKSSHVEESEYLQVSTPKQQEYTMLDPTFLPRNFEDIQHNRENNDPNSLAVAPEFANTDKTNMSKCKLEFGILTGRSRRMKRRRRNPSGTSILFGDPWNSKTGGEKSSQDEKGYGQNQHVGCISDAGVNIFPVNGFKDSSQAETSATSKEACENEIDDPNFHREMLQKPKRVLTKGAWYEENTTFPQFTGGHSKKISSGCIVNSVSEWLEELGFSKFAKLFEMHEVDEETLPLLTFEDLTDMGVDSFGPRRKLYTAIQQLRGDRPVGVCPELVKIKTKFILSCSFDSCCIRRGPLVLVVV